MRRTLKETARGTQADYVGLYSNAAVTEQSGMEDPTGDAVSERLPPEQAAQWNELYEGVWRSGVSVRMVQRLQETGRDLEVTVFAVDEPGADMVPAVGQNGRPEYERLIAMMFTDIIARVVREADDERAHRRMAEIALTLQHTMLDTANPMPSNIAVRYKPATDRVDWPGGDAADAVTLHQADPWLLVGGDFYDVIALPDGRCGLVVGDVVGKGLRAATVMGQLRSAARALLLENRGPAQVLSVLDSFADGLDGALCTTVLCAVIDTRTGHLDYSSAGHLPALLVTHGTEGHRTLSDALGPPLGIVLKRDRPQAFTMLEDGDMLLMYTDGLVGLRGEDLFDGVARAGELLSILREHDLDFIADSLLERMPPSAIPDDTALLLYRHKP